ncbi:predicted protein [Naegleria gruberi]|uniref:Predicted protein n=1 Tax=Naegleria gruberi TaxID=5762 RepID=D2VG38_NAEGR|nr:uncharacterized protein NAEGRDRAFT_67841 [Naegleria gruberi]EFC44201.1 predicted protein [Naegleria gruberi]|eukprot:XP_002676945.1 predicted protein [Naegleria gruberi strain NEG-M]
MPYQSTSRHSQQRHRYFNQQQQPQQQEHDDENFNQTTGKQESQHKDWISKKKIKQKNKYSSKIKDLKRQLAEKDERFENERFKLSVKECNKLTTPYLKLLKQDISEALKLIENELSDREDRERNCIVCMENQREIVFLQCKHFITCSSCADQLRECPICRQSITKSMKVILS